MAPTSVYPLHGETARLLVRFGAPAKSSESSRPYNATVSTSSDTPSSGSSAAALTCGLVFILASFCFLCWLSSKARRYRRTPDAQQQNKSQAFESIAKQISKKEWRSSLTDRRNPVSPYVLSQDSCSICLEHIKDLDQIHPLPCDHIFHQQCFDKWFWKTERTTTCPLCRAEFIDSAKWPKAPTPAHTAR